MSDKESYELHRIPKHTQRVLILRPLLFGKVEGVAKSTVE